MIVMSTIFKGDLISRLSGINVLATYVALLLVRVVLTPQPFRHLSHITFEFVAPRWRLLIVEHYSIGLLGVCLVHQLPSSSVYLGIWARYAPFCSWSAMFLSLKLVWARCPGWSWLVGTSLQPDLFTARLTIFRIFQRCSSHDTSPLRCPYHGMWLKRFRFVWRIPG